MEIASKDIKRLRACLLCGLVKTMSQFKRDGCDNCEELLKLRENQQKITDCTSGSYDGLIAMMNPARSWVSKWQRVDRFVPGMYAIRISGQLPEYISDQLYGDRNIEYRPRDGSVVD